MSARPPWSTDGVPEEPGLLHTHTKSGLVKLKMEGGAGQRHRMKMCS